MVRCTAPCFGTHLFRFLSILIKRLFIFTRLLDDGKPGQSSSGETHVAGFLMLHILPQSRPPAPPWGAGRYRLLDLLPPLVPRSPTCHVPPLAQVAASSVVIKCFQLQGLQISPNIHDLSRGDACPLVLRPQPERRAASGEPRNRAPLEPGSRRRGTRKTPSCPKLFTL